VSRCLLGESVRYDGSDKRNDPLIAALADCGCLMPVCPEVGAGLGVPRPPVRIVEGGEGLRARGVSDPSLDVTEAIVSYSRRLLQGGREVLGAVLKARSPSCAVVDCAVHDRAGRVSGLGPGLFAKELARFYPNLPMIDEVAAADPDRLAAFFTAVERRREYLIRGRSGV